MSLSIAAEHTIKACKGFKRAVRVNALEKALAYKQLLRHIFTRHPLICSYFISEYGCYSLEKMANSLLQHKEISKEQWETEMEAIRTKIVNT